MNERSAVRKAELSGSLATRVGECPENADVSHIYFPFVHYHMLFISFNYVIM